jgi:hypothetical protein
MNKAIKNIEANKQQLRDINTESPSAALTARTAGTVAITTAGTTLTWTNVVRSQAFTVSGTQITFPSNGYYAVEVPCRLNVNNLYMRCILNINTVNVASNTVSTPAGSIQTVFTYTFMRYFQESDVMTVILFPQVNSNLIRTAEGGLGESGIIYIAQLTGAIE